MIPSASTLDIQKRQAVFYLMKDIPINFYGILDRINNYVNYSGIGFASLLNIVTLQNPIFSSSKINAILTLSYLDFYSIYSILVANFNASSSLAKTAIAKYNYIYFLHKDLDSRYREKLYSNIALKFMYCNFSSTSNIDLFNSGYKSRLKAIADPLFVNGICTLPIEKAIETYPSSIICIDDDNAKSIVESRITYDSIEYDLYRTQNNKIGLVKAEYIKPIHDNVSCQIPPEITGSAFGYISNNFYVKVSEYIKDASGEINQFVLKCSMDNIYWSEPFSVYPNEFSDLKIENGLSTGLQIRFPMKNDVAINDGWILGISTFHINPPNLNVDLIFNDLDPISYISIDDISVFPTLINSSKLRETKFESLIDTVMSSSNSIRHFFCVGSKLQKMNINFNQSDFEIKTYNSKIAYKFNFRLNNIIAHQNQYKSVGNLLFKEQSVENATTISVRSNYFLPDDNIFHRDKFPHSFVEYNLNINYKGMSVLLPTLPSDIFSKQFIGEYESYGLIPSALLDIGKVFIINNNIDLSLNGLFTVNRDMSIIKVSDSIKYEPTIYELFTPNYVVKDRSLVPEDLTQIVEDPMYGTGICKARFPISNTLIYKNDIDQDPNGEDKEIVAANIILYEDSSHVFIPSDEITVDTSSNEVILEKYMMRYAHVFQYNVKIYSQRDSLEISFDSSKWIKSVKNLYYMYFLDDDLNFCIALRELDYNTNTLIPFTGKIAGHIEMMSIDSNWKTPLVFDFGLEVI